MPKGHVPADPPPHGCPWLRFLPLPHPPTRGLPGAALLAARDRARPA